ncbi:hypothetical protein M0804_009058 [Polistes exclamans]|nr:hypothetical protein M0804_009058 [Polistes exclamans]
MLVDLTSRNIPTSCTLKRSRSTYECVCVDIGPGDQEVISLEARDVTDIVGRYLDWAGLAGWLAGWLVGWLACLLAATAASRYGVVVI